MVNHQEEIMVNKEINKEVYTLADLDHNKVKFRHSVFDGLSVWENLETSKRENLKPQVRTDFMTIMIITQGEGLVSINMEDVYVKENSMVHFSPNTLVDLPDESHEFTISGVSFTFDFLAEIGMPERNAELFSYFSSRYSPVWNLEEEDTALIKHQIHLLAERVKKYAIHPFGKEILIHGFHIFLFEIGALGQKYSEMTRLNFSRQESLVIKFSNLVQQQFRELRTVKKYADQLNVSAKYLTEVVKEYAGKNAGEIINDLVILEAKFLLRKSELTIGEIADILHFSDQSFFGKYFKRQTGLSPKAFRESEFLSL
ncbi:MAG TPA: helix-turn-helix domain-containing protein [Sphingobacteriaceae bacterium]|nr:helix-turn-helix domain-containing protein [Sphingobacteriaceae bacterium]